MIGRSLRWKISGSFIIAALALVGTAALALAGLRTLERRIAVDYTTTKLFDLVRDVRNRENRLFLFRRAVDYREHLESIDVTRAFLAADAAWPEDADSLAARARLTSGLPAYREHVMNFWRRERFAAESAREAEEAIREERRQLVEVAETLSTRTQDAVRDGLAAHRLRLSVAIALLLVLMLGVATFLVRRIVRPLQSIENQMEEVALGRIGRVAFGWPDRELVSLAGAFNHVVQELESRQSRALQTEKLAALGTMLAGVAHELNNPLSNISTSAQILVEDAERLPLPELRRRVERIDQQAERAKSIVRTVLEHARDDRERYRTVRAADVVNGAVEALGQAGPAVRPLMLHVPDDVTVDASPGRLERALINLIDNAIGATADADPIVVAVRALPAAGDLPPMVEFSVQDCGSGMSSTQRARMFDPFYTTKPVGQGTGLGLFVTHEIVRQHGGTIEVVSRPGTGTSVSFRIPQRRRQAQS